MDIVEGCVLRSQAFVLRRVGVVIVDYHVSSLLVRHDNGGKGDAEDSASDRPYDRSDTGSDGE
jgi:hypothetical protein